MKIELLPPLTKIRITQPFGANQVSFYREMGLIGHNGTDYRARRGTPLFACHAGIVVVSGIDGTGGKIIEIITNNDGEGYKTIYYHLSTMIVNVGEQVKAGQLIGSTGNTGKYTTGPHLHFGLKITINGVTQNKDNGFRGAVNPEEYFPKNYSKSRAYHRYGRKANWYAEYCMRFAPINVKNRWADAGRYVHRASKKLKFLIPLSAESTNALVYGGWSMKTVVDPAMTQIWRWYKKDEYLKLIEKL